MAVNDTASMGAMSPQTTTANAQPALDADLVNQEVQKRLNAERVRLEQQQRSSQQPPSTATTAAPAVTRPILQQNPAPAPAPQTQTVAPPPVQVAAVPPPVAQTVTQPPVTQTEAPVVDTTPAAPRVREGDLVVAGTDGLVPARVLRRGSVPYPALAKQQRVQGTVIMSVLVSEAGRVLDVKVLRGVNRPVGLNEAAVEIMRRSEFSTPMKDGVRVKAWTTVPVDFKL
jgi:protein TonB